MFIYLVIIVIIKVKRICFALLWVLFIFLNESKHQIFLSLVAETLKENLNKHTLSWECQDVSSSSRHIEKQF